MANATTTTNPVSAIDFNEVELFLYYTRQMAGILHTMLNRLPEAPKERCPHYILNRYDLEQLCFASFHLMENIEDAEAELGRLLLCLSPPAVAV